MAIFDQIIGSLTGESSLRRIRDRSIQAGRSAYDPNVLNPQIGVAQQQAVQGIDEGAYRRDVLNQLFRPVSSAVYGGNQAAAIAGASAQDMARTRALGTFESQLAQQDIQAKQAGAEKLGQLQSSQLQIQGQRDAYTQQVRSEFEAEKDSRRRQLGTALVGFGVQAAGGAGAIGGAIGNKFQSIFGKIGPSPQDLAQAGANMAAERSLQMATDAAGAERFDFGSLDFGENLRVGVRGEGTNRLRDVVDRGMQATARTFDVNNPIAGMPFFTGAEDFPTWTPPAQAPRASTTATRQAPSREYVERIAGQSRPTPEMSPWPKVLFEELPWALTGGLFNEITRPNREVPASIDTYLNNPGLEERTLPFIKNDPIGYGRKLSPEVRAWFEQRHPGIFNPQRR